MNIPSDWFKYVTRYETKDDCVQSKVIWDSFENRFSIGIFLKL